MQLSRRNMLIGTAVGGGLLLGWGLWPRHYAAPDIMAAESEELAQAGWLKIAANGMVTVAVPQLEMGQGISTVLAQVAAVELGADWRHVAVQVAPISEIYANMPLMAKWAPLMPSVLSAYARDADGFATRRLAQYHRFMATADGMSVPAYETPLRHAAAAARTMLAMAAAEKWSANWQDCGAEGGYIWHGKDKLSFAAVVTDAAKLTPPDDVVLRATPASESPKLPRSNFARLDAPSKANGSHSFAGDVRLPDMVFAAIRHAPIGENAHLSAHNAGKAKGVKGFIKLIENPRWLAAVASNSWAAEQALRAISPTFTLAHPVDTLKIETALDRALKQGAGIILAQRGDGGAALADAGTFTQRYDIAPAHHAALETATATARLRDGRLELWMASQSPETARQAAADALGISVRHVVFYPMPAGGSFDARLEHGIAAEVALIAKSTGRAVQLSYSRWQEHITAAPRPALAAILSARTGASGEIATWKLRAALPAAALEFGQRVFGGMDAAKAAVAAGDHADPMALDGAIPPYAIANMAVEHVPCAIGLPSGRLRGNAHGYTAFFTECFVDELAEKMQREAVSYRMAMLDGDPRLAACLQRVASLAGWSGGMDGAGQGVACHRIGSIATGGAIAAIATARRDDTGIRVDRIHAVADVGRIVNIDIARQQIEGGLVFGLGLALGSSLSYADGLPSSGRLSAMELPVMANCPEIVVELIDSAAPAFDPGELGVVVAAPAIANALYSATGLRYRKLPLASEG
jgi:isoquinoline 1-oxidoreductase subunit beta